MPTKPKRGCLTQGCPNLVEGGGVYCPKCRKEKGIPTHNYGEKSEEAKDRHRFYDTAAWRKLRDSYIRRYPLCAECLRHGKIIPAKIVDHIVPVANGGDPFNEDNLQSLCQHCHEVKSNEEGSRGFKKRGAKVYSY